LLDRYDVVICDTCGAGYASGIPPQDVFDAYYRDLSKYDYDYRDGRESEEDSYKQEQLANLLTKILPFRDSRICEIGCANGKLLYLLKQRGYEQVYGADPSAGCARAAARLYGIQVATSSIFELPRPATPYDCVIMLGVLEHIRDLRRALSKVQEQLSDQGRVLIGVPDAGHLVTTRDAPFQEFSTEHINFFSASSLTNLMAANGFRRLSCDPVQLETAPEKRIPLVIGSFIKGRSDSQIVKEEETARGLAQYIVEGLRVDAELAHRIRAATLDSKNFVVWGVGTHTRRLLAKGMLAKEKISTFVDSSPKFQGQNLNGIPIIAPAGLKGRPEPIVVSSYGFQEEICRQIRDDLRLPNEVITLYEKQEQ